MHYICIISLVYRKNICGNVLCIPQIYIYYHPTALDYSVEKKLSDLLKIMKKNSFSLSRRDVLTLVILSIGST